MTRVLLVDDQAMMRLGFRMVLEAQEDIEVVGEAADGQSALTMATALQPDVVLMDVRMPRMDGITATSHLVRDHPQCRVLILTTFDLDEYAFDALRAGASGFLLKDARPDELVEAIRRVAVGDAVVAPRVTRRLIEMVHPLLTGRRDAPESGPETADPRIAELTPREREVLAAIGEGLTNREIAERFTIGEATVKTHVGNILAKLNLRDRVQAVILAYETSLVTPNR